jgi:hypothetical protein
MIRESSGVLYEYAVSVASAGGVILHGASAVTPHGAGLLFCGPSGCGKSTLATKLEARSYGVIHDEISVVLPEGDGTYRVSPLPWMATEHPERIFRQAVLTGIAFLEHARGEMTEYQPVPFEEAVLTLSKSTWFFLDLIRRHPACMQNIMAIAGLIPAGILRHSLSDSSIFDILITLEEKEMAL